MARHGDSATNFNRLHLNRILYPLVAGTALLVAACATIPPLAPLAASDPASPQAKEAPPRAFQGALAPDAATQKTHDLIVNQGKNSSPPRAEQSGGMSHMPGMNMGGAQ